MIFNGHHQREVLGVADARRSLPIIVLTERDRAEVFAAWLELLELFLLLVAGLTLLVGAMAYWMGRSIVTPLNRLIAAADASPAVTSLFSCAARLQARSATSRACST